MIRGVLGMAAAGAIAHKGDLFAQVGRNGRPTGQEMGEMNRIEFAFRKQFSVPASSIAISRNGQFVYDIAHGMADKQGAQQVQQSSLFRIASVTKPITSVTIFSLIELGCLI
jgi:CubicO group peptidase (beta-lactamase class C family)